MTVEKLNNQEIPQQSFFGKMRLKSDGGHQLLATTDTPPNSACTTSTNFSNMEFQTSSTTNRTLPEIETDCRENLENSDEGSCWQKFERVWKQRQGLTARLVSIVSLVTGYVAGYTSPAELSLKKDLEITNSQFSLISGSMPLAAVFGGLMGGRMVKRFGPKKTILVTDLLFLVGWGLIYFASHMSFILVSRIISGCAVGIASLATPVYLSETIQPKDRGALGILPTVYGNIGILSCFLMGYLCEWQGIAGLGALLCIPFILFVYFIPETPSFEGKIKEPKGGANKEAEDLLKKNQKISDEKTKVRDLFAKPNVKPLFIVLGLMFFQQMSGINAVIFYTTQIFEDTGSDIPSNIQTIIVGVVNFASTFLAKCFIDQLGRKILLYISSTAMFLTLAVLSTYFYLLQMTDINISSYGWIPLASLVVYVFGFSLGFGPIPWLMMGEILPSKIRGPAASVCTGFNWICTFIVTTSFHLIKDLIGDHGVFLLFCVVCVVGLVFVISVVPETKGQSLEDIERKLAEGCSENEKNELNS